MYKKIIAVKRGANVPEDAKYLRTEDRIDTHGVIEVVDVFELKISDKKDELKAKAHYYETLEKINE